jgi:hypothetical protein
VWQKDMDCKKICDLLAAYLDGEVTPEEKAKIETHLPGCPQCRVELESLSAMQDNLRGSFRAAAGEAEPPPYVWSKIQYRLHRERGRRGFWPVFRISLIATASTVVVAVIVFFAVMFFGGMKMGSPPSVPATSTTSSTTTTATATQTATTTTIPQTTMPSSTTTPAPGISPVVTYNKLPDIVSNYGKEVKIDLSFYNQAPETRVMSPFPPDISIIKLPNITPPDELVRTYPASGGEVEIPPGGTTAYTLDWDQKDDGGQQVAPGWYGIEVAVGSRNASGSIGQVRGIAVWVLVLPPEGVMEKTIEVNQSQTVTGLPFESGQLIDLTIIQKIEMTADSVGFTVMVTSPSYSPPQAPGLPDPRWMLGAYATYTVDSVIHDAGVAAMNPGESGLTLRWGSGLDKIDPIRADARELTFTITKIHDWEGPWTFEVPLK